MLRTDKISFYADIYFSYASLPIKFVYIYIFLQIKGTFNARRDPEAHNPYSFGGICANCLGVLCGPEAPRFVTIFGV